MPPAYSMSIWTIWMNPRPAGGVEAADSFYCCSCCSGAMATLRGYACPGDATLTVAADVSWPHLVVWRHLLCLHVLTCCCLLMWLSGLVGFAGSVLGLKTA